MAIDFSSKKTVDTDADSFPDAVAGSVGANLDSGTFTAFLNFDHTGFPTNGVTAETSAKGAAGDDLFVASNLGSDIDGYKGNDHITGGIANDTLKGGEGNDSILGGDGVGADELTGGDGNDTLVGGDGNDTLIGDTSDELIPEPGDDQLFGGSGNDYLDGMDGNDVLDGYDGNDTIIGGNGNDTITDAGLIANIDAGAGDDYIGINGPTSGLVDGGTGTDRLQITGVFSLNITGLTIANTEILETNGSQPVTAYASQFEAFDTIRYNDANLNFGVLLNLAATGGATTLDLSDELDDNGGRPVTVNGSNDNETITGGGLGDTLNGGSGNDTLYGGDGDDWLTGGIHNDNLMGQGGNDFLLGGVNNGEGDDTLDGGDGNDTLNGGNDNDTLTGGAGNDSIYDGGLGSTTNINGDDGDDFINLDGPASGTVNGGAGTDILSISFFTGSITGFTISNVEILDTNGSNSFNGKASQFNAFNTIRYDAAHLNSGVTLNLAATGGSTTLNLSTKLNDSGGRPVTVNGSTDAEAISGGGLGDTLNGNGGGDTLNGGDGADTLNGGSGNDFLNGQAGIDLLYGGADDDVLDGGDGIDFLDGGDGNDNVAGGNGNDTLDGMGGNDGLNGGAGNDFLSGGDGNDALKGGNGNDFMDGGSGTDTADYGDRILPVAVTLNGATDATVTVGLFAEDTIRNIENVTGGFLNDTLSGDGLANTLSGGGGDDMLKGGGGNDVLDGGDGSDTADYSDKTGAVAVTLNGDTDATVTVDGVAEDTIRKVENITSGIGNDTLMGDDLNNTFLGDAGDDLLKGAAGNDTLDGGVGTDTADYGDKTASVVATLKGATNATVTVGGVAEDTIRNIENVIGGSGDDTLTGNDPANLFRGGPGADTLDGRSGSDTADYGDKTDAVAVTLNGAADATVTVGGIAEDTIRNIENIIGGTANDTLTGDGFANLFRGGLGADTLDGGAGNDTADYSDRTAAVAVTLNEATDATVTVGGIAEDTIRNIENVTGGTGNDTLTGDTLNNSLLGGGGNDVLKGAAGKDTLDGGAGVDTADYGDKTASVIVALNGATNATVKIGGVNEDTIRNIENITGGTGNDTLTGAALNNTLLGDGGDDLLKGAAGNDTLDGGAGTDTADYRDKTAAIAVTLNGATDATVTVGGVAEDTIRNIENVFGGSANDTLIGDGLDNTFRGGLGADTMDGGAGADTADYGDKTTSVSVTLNGATDATVKVGGVDEDTVRNIENIIGSSANDTLTGDSLSNTLLGSGGSDLLKGAAGNDTLDGGTGIDTADYSDKSNAVAVTLNGATDATVTVGGVNEDTIRNIENVRGGSGADSLTGDGLANLFRGGLGADTLDGGAGGDTADYSDKSAAVVVKLNAATNATVTVGGVARTTSDLTVGGVAEDTIRNIENVTGGSGADTLTGDGKANQLRGNGAADTLNGKSSNDILTGGAGGDTFVFDTALNATNNVDHITDFATEDTIQLDDVVFTGIAPGTLAADAFHSAAGATEASDTDDRIVYDTTTGELYYDADGLGGVAAVKFAVLDNQAALTHDDFFVV